MKSRKHVLFSGLILGILFFFNACETFQELDEEHVSTRSELAFVLSEISGKTSETGNSATFTLRLAEQPGAEVTIPVSSGNQAEGIVSTSSLVFTPQTWYQPQQVTVTGVDDFVKDGDQEYAVLLDAAVSTDRYYNGVRPAQVRVINIDNESPGFSVSAISGQTSESGKTATFTVQIHSQPASEVVIPLKCDNEGEGRLAQKELRFTPQAWEIPQTVLVEGVDDQVTDGDQEYNILLEAVVSEDSVYQGLDPNDVRVLNEDNEKPGFTLSEISGNTTEAGETATFTVKLNSQPTGTVVIAVVSLNVSEGTASPASLTFTPENWNAKQIVTVTGVNDDIVDGNQSYKIQLTLNSASTTDTSGYASLAPNPVSVTNTDDETAGFTISAISGNTNELGGAATFTVKLNSQPNGNVVINGVTSDTTEGSVSPAQLTFTPDNWNAKQTVTATGVNDYLMDGNQSYTIQLTLNLQSTTDTSGYSSLTPDDVSVTNTDNDSAGFTISSVSGNSTEADGQSTFTVRLNSEPTANVSLELSSSDTTEGTVSPVTLTFTPLNWNASQTVTVTGVNDDVADGNQSYTIVLAAAVSSDINYNNLNPKDMELTNTDNDSAGFTISSVSGNTTETGGTATFTVKLNSEPIEEVSLGISSSDSTEGTVTPSSLVFTPLNWNASQTVTVTGVNDDLADGNQSYTIVLAAAVSSDTNYNNLNPDDVGLTNTDDETAGFTISSVSGNSTEAGGTATFSVKLNSEPTGDVTLGINSPDLTEGTVTPSSLTFTTANWNANQTVTVAGVNDDIADGNQDYSLQLTVNTGSTLDTSGYAALPPKAVTVINTDDETAGFTISGLSKNTAEEGTTATFTVKLTSQPTGNVMLNVAASDSTEGTVSPSILTFTTANWNANQTVTVTGVEDEIADGNQDYTIQLTINAGSTPDISGYASLNPDDVSVINIDDETAGFTISALSGNTAEDGTMATFTVKLNSEPEGNLVLNLGHLNRPK
ncbi:Calx-beta domain-containing protein [Deltaproteobacteria bacterium TL4]